MALQKPESNMTSVNTCKCEAMSLRLRFMICLQLFAYDGGQAAGRCQYVGHSEGW